MQIVMSALICGVPCLVLWAADALLSRHTHRKVKIERLFRDMQAANSGT